MDFLSLAVLLVTVVRRVRDIFRFVDRVQPVKVKSVCKAGEREGYLSLPPLGCLINMFTALSLVCENCAEIHYDDLKTSGGETWHKPERIDSILWKPLWAGQCQRIVQHDIHSLYLALCWVSKAVPCCNAVMFLSYIPLRDAFGLSVVVLYLLIFFHQTWIVKLAWRGLFYHWTLKEARKSSF